MSDDGDTGRETSRREILRRAALGGAGLALGATAACAGDGRAAPEATTRVPLERVPLGERVRIDHHGEPVVVHRSAAGVEARSLICTHQRCQLFWHPSSDAYRCPCHAATFDSDGRPGTGPVTEPMWRLPARVEDDTLVIGGA